ARGAGAPRGAADASDWEGCSVLADSPKKLGRRAAKRKAIAPPADRERIAPAVKYQRAAAGGAANDEAGLNNVEPDAAAVGVGAGHEPGAGHGQSNQRGTNSG